MYYSIQGVDYFVEMTGDEHAHPIVLLHGFTGSTSTWTAVKDILSKSFQVITIDLLGHGQTSSPRSVERYTMEKQIDDLHEIFQQLDVAPFTLVGYSMGGRTALAYAQQFGHQLHSLVLESASPGLRTEKERETRRTSDANLATRIIEEGIDSFVDFWEQIPLFDTQKTLPVAKRLDIRQERLRQNPIGLANSLKGMGTGSQPSYWQQLHELTMPILLLTGSLDSKFVTIAQEMMSHMPNVQHYSLENAGHAIHVEKPLQFATMIEEYITNLKL